MKPLTYRELLAACQELSEELLDSSVTIFEPTTNECFPIYDHVLYTELPQEIQDELDFDNEQPLLVTIVYNKHGR